MRVRIQPMGNVVAASVDVAERRAVHHRRALGRAGHRPRHRRRVRQAGRVRVWTHHPPRRAGHVRRVARRPVRAPAGGVRPARVAGGAAGERRQAVRVCLARHHHHQVLVRDRPLHGQEGGDQAPAGGRARPHARAVRRRVGVPALFPRPPAARRRSTSNTGVPASSVEEETGVCPGPPPFACPDASRPRVDRLSSNAPPCDHAIHGGPPSGSDPIQTRSTPPPHGHGPVMPSPARVVVGGNPARRAAATLGAPVQGVLRGAPSCGAVSPCAARDSARGRRVQPLRGLRATPTGRLRHPERLSGHAGSRRVCPRVWWDRAGCVAAVAGGQGRGRDRDRLGRGTSR